MSLSPASASARLASNTSPGSFGLGGVPISSTSPFGAALVAGTMSLMAFSVRICASSNTSMSTFAKPRPNPDSRAPNKIRDPFLNRTACSPFVARTALTYAATLGLRLIDRIDWNVSFAVLVLCAVQITVNPACNMHKANAIHPTV